MRRLPGLLLAVLVAGCSGAPEPSAGAAGAGDGGEPLAAANVRAYATPHPGGAPYTRDYSGVARDEPGQLQGLPGGPAQGPVQTCCLYTWLPASDLLAPDQMVALRARLDWTNTAQDQANLDVALCVPWFCGFGETPDQSGQAGAHSETIDIVTGGHRQFLDNGNAVQVGVRYSNGVFATGVPFTLHVEVVPVADGLAFLDPYEVVVPPNGTLAATLAGPLRGGDVSAGLMVYGEDDRPLAYHALAGANGSRHVLGHGPGSYVVAAFEYDGALLRLDVENATADPPAARPLQEAFGEVEVAAVADPAPREGTWSYESPPGSLDTFPFFLADAGAQVASGPATQSTIRMTSSRGVVADVAGALVGGTVPALGQVCLTCSVSADWTPANYVDDDGRYDVAYATTGATGRFVLFTATYAR